jgi:hypothetical protein
MFCAGWISATEHAPQKDAWGFGNPYWGCNGLIRRGRRVRRRRVFISICGPSLCQIFVQVVGGEASAFPWSGWYEMTNGGWWWEQYLCLNFISSDGLGTCDFDIHHPTIPLFDRFRHLAAVDLHFSGKNAFTVESKTSPGVKEA